MKDYRSLALFVVLIAIGTILLILVGVDLLRPEPVSSTIVHNIATVFGALDIFIGILGIFWWVSANKPRPPFSPGDKVRLVSTHAQVTEANLVEVRQQFATGSLDVGSVRWEIEKQFEILSPGDLGTVIDIGASGKLIRIRFDGRGTNAFIPLCLADGMIARSD